MLTHLPAQASRSYMETKGFKDGYLDKPTNDKVKSLLKNNKDAEAEALVAAQRAPIEEDHYKIEFLADLICNKGYSSFDDTRYDYKDVITTSQLSQFIPHVVEIIMKPEVDPQTPISTLLFDEINTYTGQTIVELGAISRAVEVDHVDEQGEYPIINALSYDGGNAIRVSIQKIGIKMGWTVEAKELDRWGIISNYFSKIGQAFARKRETMCIDLMSMHGTTIYDNANPANSRRGVLTGRGIDGAPNGTLSPDDLLWMYTWGQHRGYNPDTLIIHPFSWLTFMSSPEMRELMLSGTQIQNYDIPGINNQNTMGGRLGKLGPDTKLKGAGLFGGLTNSTQNPGTIGNIDPLGFPAGANPSGALGASIYGHQTISPLAYGVQIQPKFSPTPFNVIVSPWVQFFQTTSVNSINPKYATNIIMCDSNNIGAIVRKNNIISDGWDDKEHDTEWIRMQESYGGVIYAQGEAILTAKNVIIDKNYVFDNVNQVSLTEVPAGTQIAGVPFAP